MGFSGSTVVFSTFYLNYIIRLVPQVLRRGLRDDTGQERGALKKNVSVMIVFFFW